MDFAAHIAGLEQELATYEANDKPERAAAVKASLKWAREQQAAVPAPVEVVEVEIPEDPDDPFAEPAPAARKRGSRRTPAAPKD